MERRLGRLVVAWAQDQMEDLMMFHIFQCKKDQDHYVVTDRARATDLTAEKCKISDDELEKIGVFPEMGEERAAFSEGKAKKLIDIKGFYDFEAKEFDLVAERPGYMSM